MRTHFSGAGGSRNGKVRVLARRCRGAIGRPKAKSRLPYASFRTPGSASDRREGQGQNRTATRLVPTSGVGAQEGGYRGNHPRRLLLVSLFVNMKGIFIGTNNYSLLSSPSLVRVPPGAEEV
jgi:hypothetical protein